MKWTIEEALAFIRDLQDQCMDSGYYLALAGGVLNKGFSDSDLDIVAMPRTKESRPRLLHHVLNDRLGQPIKKPSAVCQAFVYSYFCKGRYVEIVLVNNHWKEDDET